MLKNQTYKPIQHLQKWLSQQFVALFVDITLNLCFEQLVSNGYTWKIWNVGECEMLPAGANKARDIVPLSVCRRGA